MVPMCVLVGASLSEPHINCAYRSLCTCVHCDVMVMADTCYHFMPEMCKILNVESLCHATVWLFCLLRPCTICGCTKAAVEIAATWELAKQTMF